MIDCIILAGGLGTRLKGVLEDIPKPMAQFKGVPFLEIVIRYVHRFRIGRFVISVGYKSDHVMNHFKNGQGFGVDIDYAIETEPLGTGGAIALSAEKVRTHDFLVINGDSLCLADYGQFCDFHLSKKSAVTILGVHSKDVSRFGSIESDNTHLLRGFREKTGIREAGIINAGIYAFSKTSTQYFPRQRRFSIERDFFQRNLKMNFSVFTTESPFIDIGTPEDFRRADSFLIDHSLLQTTA